MRLFTGIEISEDVKNKLERLLLHLRPFAHLKWSPVYNLHITLKFIGQFPDNRLDEMIAALHSVPKLEPFEIAVRDLGWFPNARNPKVFWAGVEGGSALANLAQAVEGALEDLGVGKESRSFSPHLTLARIRQPTPLQPLRTALEPFHPHEFGTFEPANFILYESQPGPAGSIYKKLAEIPIASRLPPSAS